MSGKAIKEGRHFCRGCGRELPAQFCGLFHKDCLKVDKRRRVQELRRKEQERFQVWLRKQVCTNCGVRFGEGAKSDQLTEAPCEPSQRPRAANSG
jgi:hypothetical protein